MTTMVSREAFRRFARLCYSHVAVLLSTKSDEEPDNVGHLSTDQKCPIGQLERHLAR